MNLKDYKEISSKIDEKLKEDNIDEENDKLFKKARRIIFVITSPPSSLLILIQYSLILL